MRLIGRLNHQLEKACKNDNLDGIQLVADVAFVGALETEPESEESKALIHIFNNAEFEIITRSLVTVDTV